MIRYVDADGRDALLAFLSRDALGLKIAGNVHAYGFGLPFVEYWMLTDDSGRPLAALGRLDGSLTLCIDPHLLQCPGLVDELATFCRMLPTVRTVTCPATLDLGFLPAKSGWILRHNGEPESKSAPRRCMRDESPHHTPQNPDTSKIVTDVSSMELYTLLCACEGDAIELPPRDAFVTDFSHRFRHGMARCFAVKQGETPLAAVFSISETADAALIGGVATHPKHRREGHAAALLWQAVRSFAREDKEVFLFCLDSALPYYEKQGFTADGRWAVADIL